MSEHIDHEQVFQEWLGSDAGRIALLNSLNQAALKIAFYAGIDVGINLGAKAAQEVLEDMAK